MPQIWSILQSAEKPLTVEQRHGEENIRPEHGQTRLEETKNEDIAHEIPKLLVRVDARKRLRNREDEGCQNTVEYIEAVEEVLNQKIHMEKVG